MKRVVARVSHQIPDRPALALSSGEVVDVGLRSEEWPEFVFVTAAGGSGWVPVRHLSVSAGQGVVLTPYDTTELPTVEGDRLVVVFEDLESGWLWCRSATGAEGWVPVKTVRPTD